MAEVTSERDGTAKELAPEEVRVPELAVDKEAVVEKDATPVVVVGEEPIVGEATPEVMLELVLDDAGKEVEAVEATLGDGAD